MNRPHIPLLGFAAYSGTGKTTLLEALLPKLTGTGLRIGVLKHAHHDFDVDVPGKDSYRLRKAGASQMLVASRYRHVLMTETPDSEAEFDYLLSRFDTASLDLILVEGCKNIAFPKIELHRAEVGKPWLHPYDSNIIAVASDTPAESDMPQLDINDLEGLTQFVLHYVQQRTPALPAASCDTLSPAWLSVEQGQQKVLEAISPLCGQEILPVEQSYDRILATNVISPIHVPQYTNSAMDGYAIRGDDTERGTYRVVADIMAGSHYPLPLQPGEAVKIMTGAPVPQYADTVIMREQATPKGDTVTLSTQDIRAGQNVRQAGEDLKQGQAIFTAGTRVLAAEMGMLASVGLGNVPVVRRLKVAIFSTGNEVQAPGTPLATSTIYDSNRFTLTGLLQNLNCKIIDFGILEDDQEKMAAALHQAAETADVVITSGGVSVGDADYIKSALNQLGHIDFWRINMRPGRPLAFGQISHKPFFGLPGNPVAVMVSFINFVEPAIRKMQGQQSWNALKIPAVAMETIRSRPGRTEFSRGVYSLNSKGQLEVRSTGKQGSGILRSMSEANCLIEVAPAADTVKPGESVTIIPLQGRI